MAHVAARQLLPCHVVRSGAASPRSLPCAVRPSALSQPWPTSTGSNLYSRKLSVKAFAMAASGASAAPEVAQSAPVCPPECVTLAHSLADKAGDIIRRYFRMPIDVQIKMDRSPVTIADEAVEAELRKTIRSTFPDHGILGEEGGVDVGDGNGEYVWVIDPIDGTASFISGKPLFGVLIALLHKGVPVLGLMDQPILKERWFAARSFPSSSAASEEAELVTTFNGQPVKVRSCGALSSAHLYSTSPHLFTGESEFAFTRLQKQAWRTSYGCDCYAFGLLSLGFVDIVVEHGMKPWDYFALIPIVEGAGGIFTDWQGNPLRLNSFNKDEWVGECLAAGDAAAHKEALDALAWKRADGSSTA